MIRDGHRDQNDEQGAITSPRFVLICLGQTMGQSLG